MQSILDVFSEPIQLIDSFIDYIEDQLRQLHDLIEFLLGSILNFFL